MSFPNNPTPLDNFNRSNGAPGANWSTAKAFAGTDIFQILSNRASPSNDYVVAYWNPATFGPNSEVYSTMATRTSAAGDGPYLLLRLTTPGASTLDGYCLAVETAGADWEIYRVDNSVWTQLGATFSGSCANGDLWGLEAIGSTLTAYKKSGAGAWTAQFTRTDATYNSAGYLGMYIGADENSQKQDDFSGGVAVAASFSLCMPTIARKSTHMLVR